MEYIKVEPFAAVQHSKDMARGCTDFSFIFIWLGVKVKVGNDQETFS